MSNIALIRTGTGVSLFIGNKTYTIPNTDPNFQRILELYGQNDSKGLSNLMEIKKGNIAHVLKDIKEGFKYTEKGVTYNGKLLHGVLVDKIISMLRDGSPDLEPLKAFLENTYKNPNPESIEKLYSFLSIKELPITPDGCFIAYKAVSSDYYSQYGNTQTKVIKGKVDGMGRIYNGVGEVIEVDRKSVDNNPSRECSHGIHGGSFQYAKTYQRNSCGIGGHLMIVKIHPQDVVTVPNADFSKMRVCKYEVLAEYQENHEIEVPVISEDYQKDPNNIPERGFKNVKDWAAKIGNYFKNKIANKEKEVTLRQLKNSLKNFPNTTLQLIEFVRANFKNVTIVMDRTHLTKSVIKLHKFK